MAWLSLAAIELANGPTALRGAVRFKRLVNTDRATAVKQRAFGLMRSTLAGQPWRAETATGPLRRVQPLLPLETDHVGNRQMPCRVNLRSSVLTLR